MTDDFPKEPARFAELDVIGLFRCDCGQLCAMAEQLDGNAAMVHGSPHCERFEAVRSCTEGLAYFGSLPVVPMTLEALGELKRSQQHC